MKEYSLKEFDGYKFCAVIRIAGVQKRTTFENVYTTDSSKESVEKFSRVYADGGNAKLIHWFTKEQGDFAATLIEKIRNAPDKHSGHRLPHTTCPFYGDRYSIAVVGYNDKGEPQELLRWDFSGEGWVQHALSDGPRTDQYNFEWLAFVMDVRLNPETGSFL